MYYLDVFCTVIDIISVCGSIPIEIPILWPRAVMVGPRPRVFLTLPLVVCVWCDVFCRFVVVGRCILIDIDRYLLCFVITVFACV